MTDEEILCKAIDITESRLKDIPDFDIYESIVRQLQYLLSIIKGNEIDKGKLGKITLGHLAVHEFEESDPELSGALKKCQNIAFKLEADN